MGHGDRQDELGFHPIEPMENLPRFSVLPVAGLERVYKLRGRTFSASLSKKAFIPIGDTGTWLGPAA